MDWTINDTWIVLIGVLCAIACALVGNFMVLRRMSMMGDAISHAVLPGIAIAFLVTASRDLLPIAIGAVVVGVLTAVLTQLIHQLGRVDTGAAMGVVFTTLFAIGLVLIVRGADAVDLDPGCVLYGGLEITPLDVVNVLGAEVPRAMLVVGAVALVNALFVIVFYKEMKISSFDPALATTLGFNATALHYVLMVLVAITTVAAFEVVGSILVVAMLIVPGATAHLLTDRLAPMIWVSLVVAAASAGLGHIAAIITPSWIGFEGLSTNIAGMMAVAGGGVFFVALLLAPRHGVLSKLRHRWALGLRIVREDVLGFLYRLEELGLAHTHGVDAGVLSDALGISRWPVCGALMMLDRSGLVNRGGARLELTNDGRTAAASLVRSHRLWETYLARNLDLPIDHVHMPAERLEHVTDPDLQRRLAEEMHQPSVDPHGKKVPE